MRAFHRALLVIGLVVTLWSGTARADAPDEAKKAEAQAHFERGLELSAEQAWSAAFAEYARSRALYPTRAAAKNAAVCLRQLHRYDEALEMIETLVREFPNLPDRDRAFVDKESRELAALVGFVSVRGAEAGATITIDGRERGKMPVSSPIRLAVGSHAVRVTKSGFLPFESRVDLTGGQSVTVEARLEPLARAGRLRVTEEGGAPAVVVVDNAVVGNTPWEGSLSIGEHSVVLRGDGNLGTQPAHAPVRLNEQTSLTLRLEPLDAAMRVETMPVGAVVAVDGVSVGRGVWEGSLRAGVHQLEVGAEGFVPVRRQVTLAKDQREVLSINLERDLESPTWLSARKSRFFVDSFVAGVIGPAGFGGDIAAACSGACIASGALARLQAGYELRNGLGFALDVGYARATQEIGGRRDALTPIPRGTSPANRGTSDDRLVLSGVLVGASAAIHRGEPFSWLARLGGGALIGSVSDTRTGTYTTVLSLRPDGTQGTPATYSIAPLQQSLDARYVYVAGEARLGSRFGDHFELGAAVEAIVLVALTQPRSSADALTTPTGTCTPTATDCVRDGLAGFDATTATSKVLLLVPVGLTARYSF